MSFGVVGSKVAVASGISDEDVYIYLDDMR
jgi:hypothetical protein